MSTDISALHAAIESEILSRFPELRAVESYHDARKLPSVPAVLLEMEALEPTPDDDPGTEQLSASAAFSARIVFGFRHPDARMAIRVMAAAMGAMVNGNRWGQGVGAAVVTDISADDFAPELDQFEVWRVDWLQPVYLGDSVWNDSRFPARVAAQFAGTGNQPGYAVPIDPAATDGDWRAAAPAESGPLYSYEPDTGEPHEGDYQRVDGGER